jgi:hypothetical protein
MKPVFYESGRDLNGFCISLNSGIMAAGLAAGSEILQLRWTSTTKRCLIKQLHLTAANDGTAFAAGSGLFELVKAHTWTANGTGGTVATLTGNNANITASNPDTALVQLRYASTTNLGTGTKTLLDHPLEAALIGVPATAGILLLDQDLFLESPDEEHPIVLDTNEGIIIRATVPATGTWKFSVNLKWLESN